MLEHTKAHPIEAVDLCVTGPADRMEEALAQLATLGFARKTEPETRPWREVLGIQEEDVPAACLRGARDREGLTQKALEARTGIPARHISEMEHGKRPIGKQNARKLGEALHVSYKVFL